MQYYTNYIENYFSILKNYLYKNKDLGYIKLNENIKSIIKEIQLIIYENIFKGSYERTKEFKIKKYRRIKIKYIKILKNIGGVYKILFGILNSFNFT